MVAILALSGMRLAELRRLRVAHCGRGAFRVGECRANDGPREVPIHSALAGTTIRLTKQRAGDALLIGDGGDFGRAPSPMQRRFDACRAAVGVVGPSLGMRGFKSFALAQRFCRGHDELRDFLRPRTRHDQHVPADRRRRLHLRRATAALAILEAA